MKQRALRAFSLLPFFLLLSVSMVVFSQSGDKCESVAIGVNCGGKIFRGSGKAAFTPELAIEERSQGKTFSAPLSGGEKSCMQASQPEMIDLTTLYVAKNGDGTILYLSWNYDDPLFNIFRCYEPSFQNGVTTLAKDLDSTSMEVKANTSKTLECFDVAGASVVSMSTQGMGYDPEPSPSVPTFSGAGYWWGDDITLTADYLDPIAKGNIAFMGDLPVRAGSVTAGGNYATDATFTIPDDARGFYPIIEVNGRSSDPGGSYSYVSLYAKGIGPYSNIKGISYAPQTGKIWVAASGIVEEVNLFLRTPATGVEFTDASNPYISRVTNDGRILYVDGVNGVSTIWQVDVSSGARTVYASTTDDDFTRAILPCGIGVDPDGSACYIADANNGKVVRIPANAGPGTSTIKDNWGNRTFGFPDPCGIDVNIGHQVLVASTSGCIYEITGQNSSYVSYCPYSYVHSIEIDRDYSISSYIYYSWSNEVGMTEAFNRNNIGSNLPAYHGATVFGTSDGYIDLEIDWTFYTYRRFPQRVILNNSGQGIGYPSAYQTTDRIIELKVSGWAYRPLKLTVIDPPDLSPYAPDGGCLQTGCSSCLPYAANDNIGNSDYGICAQPDCSDGASLMKTLYCGSDGTLTCYLKVPAQYAGDNFQVEVQKTDFYGGALPEPKVAMLSSVYTSWKRVFVERDKMFRRGGLLYEEGSDPVVIPAGRTFLRILKGPSGVQIDNLNIGDKIAIFDANRPYEGQHDECYIGTIDRTSYTDYALITLKQSDLSTDYTTKYDYTTSPMDAATHYPDFSKGSSAAVGVVYSTTAIEGKTVTDTSSNQINGEGSAFYDADMRAIEKTFNDAFVEFYGLRDGMGAVPYISNSLDDFYVITAGSGSADPGRTMRNKFQLIWFKNHDRVNYLHYLGVRGPNSDSTVVGFTWRWSLYTFIHQETIEQHYPDPGLRLNFAQTINNHEMGHQCKADVCVAGGHDSRPAWCNTDLPQYCPGEPCLMNADGGEPTNDIRKFCKEDLFLGDPVCVPPSGNCTDGSIRGETELVKTE